MRDASDLTLIDYWPLGVLALLAVFCVAVVFRGLRRPGDSSNNQSSGGGADFPGHGGRW